MKTPNLVALAMLAAVTISMQVTTPAAAAEQDSRADQFDFWLGDWELTSQGKPTGTNRITREYDGAVIIEHFSGTPHIKLNGMSVSVFKAKTGKWHQTWVDNQGGYLDFVGEFGDGKMILSRRANVRGKDILQRMVWHNIQEDSLDWNWERSEDGGATWELVWGIHYQRKSE